MDVNFDALLAWLKDVLQELVIAFESLKRFFGNLEAGEYELTEVTGE